MEKELKIRSLKKLVNQSAQHLEQSVKNAIANNQELEKEISLFQAYKRELHRCAERVQVKQEELSCLCSTFNIKDQQTKQAEEQKNQLQVQQEKLSKEYRQMQTCVCKKIETTTLQMHQVGSSIKNQREILQTMQKDKQDREAKYKNLKNQLHDNEDELEKMNKDIKTVEGDNDRLQQENVEVRCNINEATRKCREKTRQLNEVKSEVQCEEKELDKLSMKQEDLQKQVYETETTNKCLQNQLTEAKDKGYGVGVENEAVTDYVIKQEASIDRLNKMIDDNTDQIEEFQHSNSELVKQVAELEYQEMTCKFCRKAINDC